MGYYSDSNLNLDKLAEDMLTREENRLDALEAIDEEDTFLYLVTMGNLQEYCTNQFEIDFLLDEAEVRGLDCTVERLDY